MSKLEKIVIIALTAVLVLGAYILYEQSGRTDPEIIDPTTTQQDTKGEG